MQKLKSNHGYPKVSRALRYASIRLRSRPETAPLGREIEAERTGLEKAKEAHAEIREERVAATAVIWHQDALVDAAVAALAREVMVITGGKTDDAFYKSLFPVAPSTATQPLASDSQNRFVKALVDRVETDDRYQSLRTTAQTIKEAQAELDRLLVEREALRTPELRAEVDLKTALDSARRAYNKLYPKLSLLYDSKAFIETFFVTVDKSGKAEQAALDEAFSEDGEAEDEAVSGVG